MIKTVIVLELWCERPIENLGVQIAQRAYTIPSVANAFPLAEGGAPSPRDPSLDQVETTVQADEARARWWEAEHARRKD